MTIFFLQFQKTESDLDYVSRKLDAEFANSNDELQQVWLMFELYFNIRYI